MLFEQVEGQQQLRGRGGGIIVVVRAVVTRDRVQNSGKLFVLKNQAEDI